MHIQFYMCTDTGSWALTTYYQSIICRKESRGKFYLVEVTLERYREKRLFIFNSFIVLTIQHCRVSNSAYFRKNTILSVSISKYIWHQFQYCHEPELIILRCLTNLILQWLEYASNNGVYKWNKKIYITVKHVTNNTM